MQGIGSFYLVITTRSQAISPNWDFVLCNQLKRIKISSLCSKLLLLHVCNENSLEIFLSVGFKMLILCLLNCCFETVGCDAKYLV